MVRNSSLVPWVLTKQVAFSRDKGGSLTLGWVPTKNCWHHVVVDHGTSKIAWKNSLGLRLECWRQIPNTKASWFADSWGKTEDCWEDERTSWNYNVTSACLNSEIVQKCVFLTFPNFHFPSVFMYKISINQGGGQPSNVRPTAVRRGLHSSNHWDHRVCAPCLVLLSVGYITGSLHLELDSGPSLWGEGCKRKSTDELWYSFVEFCVVSICSDMMNLSIGREDESKYDMV